MITRTLLLSLTVLLTILFTNSHAQERKRPRDLGIDIGILQPGQWNAITDVEGVKVGHTTLIEGDNIRTGVTVIVPHDGNLFREKVPGAVYVGNAFGKAIGFTQVEELGNIETPVALTGTLNIWRVADGLVSYMLDMQENRNVGSINPVVGETNDGGLNDIRGRHVNAGHVAEALRNASDGPVEEGNVGAGTGTRCLGFKGGIGTSSRVLPEGSGGYTVGVLVQTNFGGILTINGAPVGRELDQFYSPRGLGDNSGNESEYEVDGSCMIVIATDAPLSARNLKRLAKRSYLAFGRVGSFSSNGSGDYSIAFSTNPAVRIAGGQGPERNTVDIDNNSMSPLFLAVVEATEEAIYNSMFMATDMTSRGRTVQAIPIDETVKILEKYNALKWNSRLNPYNR
ncbi:P1 family peptidase [candidate division KSB1 bacterium]